LIGYLARRLLGTIPVVLLIMLFVFLLVHAAPGDPADMLISDEASKEDVAAARQRWGLDQPVLVQFGRFVTAAARLDFGESFKYSEPVTSLIAERFPASLELALLATLIAIAVALPLGVWAAARPHSWVDTLGSTAGFIGISMPHFWLAIVLILVFSGYFNWLPSSGRETLGLADDPITGFATLDAVLHGNGEAFRDALLHMVMPAFVLSLNMVGIVMRVTRSSMLDVLGEDYVMTARAKGVPESAVIWKHGFRNALVTVITVVGLEFGALLSGSIIIETVFAWPGIGSLLLQGIGARDYPLVTGVVLVYTCLFILVNLLVDLLYAATDPRIRLGA
jgi:ABC-type dipeptide/oligopeptide/nickel transport system permease component